MRGSFALFFVGCAQVLDLSALSEDAHSDAFDAFASDACVPPVHGECNPYPEHLCGCTKPLLPNCEIVDSTGTSACSQVGSTPLWGYCGSASLEFTGTGYCQKGASCVDHACKPFCETNADCPGTNRICRQYELDGVPVPGLKYCTAGCDLVDPAAICEPQVTCNPVADGDFNDVGDCFGGVGSSVGAGACATQASNCAPGYFCIADSGACAKWCRQGIPSDCAMADGGDASTFCTPTSPPTLIGDGQVPYGLCE